MKRVIKTSMMVAMLLIFANACKKDPPNNNNNGNNNTPTTAPEQYILMNGLKVKIKNPANGSISVAGGDTSLKWSGNQPSTLIGDSLVVIEHPVRVKRGSNTISEIASDYGEVYIAITYGETDSKTAVIVKEGDYKLEKVNNIWYSVLKNGKAEGKKGSADVTYTGVEFRVAWPSTFK